MSEEFAEQDQDAPIAAEELASFVERIERLTEEKDVIAADIKEVYAESKGRGYDPKVLKKIIADRKIEREELKEMRGVYDVYAESLGML